MPSFVKAGKMGAYIESVTEVFICTRQSLLQKTSWIGRISKPCVVNLVCVNMYPCMLNVIYTSLFLNQHPEKIFLSINQRLNLK